MISGVATMPSTAFTQHLVEWLWDADELLDAQRQLLLHSAQRRRQWGRGSLNRAIVVTCVSAWEAYVEQVVIEAITAMRPAAGSPLGIWAALEASVNSSIRRLHTPNVDNVRGLLATSLGLPDVTIFWSWKNCTRARVLQQLARALQWRHQIAHGVHPRPVIPTKYATGLPKFFLRLGSRTDAGIRDYLVNNFGIAHPWPP